MELRTLSTVQDGNLCFVSGRSQSNDLLWVDIHLLPCSLRSVSEFVRHIANKCLITLRPRHLILNPEHMLASCFLHWRQPELKCDLLLDFIRDVHHLVEWWRACGERSELVSS